METSSKNSQTFISEHQENFLCIVKKLYVQYNLNYLNYAL